MPEADQEGARVVVERIRTLLNRYLEEGQWSSTLSVGLVTFVSVTASIDQMIKAADDLMCRAKKGGKDFAAKLIVQGG